MAVEQPRQVEDEEEETSGAGECCKTLMKFMLSQVGLCLIVILYSVAGGFIFQHLEQTNEKQECIKKMEKYVVMANETKVNIWTASKAYVQQYMDDDQDPDVATKRSTRVQGYAHPIQE